MLKKAVEEAINEQIKQEFSSAYVYLAMSAYFESKNFAGFAKWMRLQHEEELAHAMRLFDYVHDRGGQVALHGIEPPPTDFSGPLDVFEQALTAERTVTQLINDLYRLAGDEKDPATEVALEWFISEQVEEEKTAEEIVEKLKLIGNNGMGLFMLDQELGARQRADSADATSEAG